MIITFLVFLVILCLSVEAIIISPLRVNLQQTNVVNFKGYMSQPKELSSLHTKYSKMKLFSMPDVSSYDNDIVSKIKNKKIQWKAGDVESDLSILKIAIKKSQANNEFSRKERKDVLNEFSRQKKELFPGLRLYVAIPLAITFFLSICLRITSTSKTFTSLKNIGWLLIKSMDIFYWGVSIISPLYLLLIGSKRGNHKPTAIDRTEEINPLTPEELEYCAFWHPNYKLRDCSNFALCILENWASSIIGALALGLYTLFSLKINMKTAEIFLPFYRNPLSLIYPVLSLVKSSSTDFCLAMSQLIHRLGAAAAIHQYPRLLYKLRNINQPRPLSYLSIHLNQIVSLSLKILPIAFACDMANIFFIISKMSMKFYPKEMVSSLIRNKSSIQIMPKLVKAFFFILSITPSVIHLLAFIRLIQVQFSTNISLAMEDNDTYVKMENDSNSALPLANKPEPKWRYKLRWREDVRLSQATQDIWQNFQIFMLSGWGGFETGKVTSAISGKDAARVQAMSKLSILFKEFRDERHDPNLMKSSNDVAAIHQEDYDKREFNDPLGIAVQQTLGIGLSFDFDHDTVLEKGKVPSIHRLRSRAAKSAVKRINQIIKENNARLDKIQNIKDKEKEELRLCKKLHREKKKLSKALLDLIPYDAPPPEGENREVETYATFEDSFNVNISQLALLNDPLDDNDIDLENKVLNDMNNSPPSSNFDFKPINNSTQVGDKNVFVSDWLKQNSMPGFTDDDRFLLS